MTVTWHARYRLLKDNLLHHSGLRRLVASGLWWRTRLTRQTPTQRCLTLARAAHICPSGSAFLSLCRELHRELERLQPTDIEWGRIAKKPADPCDVPKGILLKPHISPREKGVLHVPFEDQWLRLFRDRSPEAIRQLADEYDLILGPSWSPPPEPALLLAARFWPGRLYTFLSNLNDAERMRAVSPRLEPIPLLSSSWVDPNVFLPYLDQPRDLDIVLLANFAAFKRHWLLFDALRALPRSYRVLLMGVPMEGRDDTALRREAERFNVSDRFEVVVRPSRTDIARNLARARVSLILSRREGSCVAVAESLFANTPVGLIDGAHIGSQAFLNDRTGRRLRSNHLAEDLHRFVAQADTFSPRAWALSHISCRQSLSLLNHWLRTRAGSDGREWTRDLEPIAKDTISIYLDPVGAQAMQAHIDTFERRHGLRLGRGIRPVASYQSLAAVA